MSSYLDKTGLTVLWNKAKSSFVAQEDGMSLSSNDYTDEDKEKVTNLVSATDLSGGTTDYGTIEITDNVVSLSNAPAISGTGTNSVIFNDHENNVASGKYSAAFGSSNTASGNSSFAAGSGSSATGAYSFAIGALGSEATSQGSISLNGKALGICSVAVGPNASAYSSNDVAIGEMSQTSSSAYNYSKIAIGYRSNTSGHQAISLGPGAIASGDYQVSVGSYNVEDTDNEYAFIVGNGTDSDNRSNALTVDWDGNAVVSGGLTVNDIDIVATLDEKSTVSVSQSYASGQKIATITVDDTSTDLYAPSYNYSAGTGLTLANEQFSLDTVALTSTTSTQSPAAGDTISVVSSVTTDSYGRVTTINTTTITLPEDSDTLNTTGSTEGSARLYLVGATSQTDSAQTYSRSTVFIGVNGNMYSPTYYYYDGTNYVAPLRVYEDDDGATDNGMEMTLTAYGNTFVGAGESPGNLRTALRTEVGEGESYSATAERLYLTADSAIAFYANCGTIEDRIGMFFTTNGYLRPMVDNTLYLGNSSYYWNSAYINNIVLAGLNLGDYVSDTGWLSADTFTDYLTADSTIYYRIIGKQIFVRGSLVLASDIATTGSSSVVAYLQYDTSIIGSGKIFTGLGYSATVTEKALVSLTNSTNGTSVRVYGLSESVAAGTTLNFSITGTID